MKSFDAFRLSLSIRFFFSTLRPPPGSTLFPYTTLFRSRPRRAGRFRPSQTHLALCARRPRRPTSTQSEMRLGRSEEHTSELQSRGHLVCRLLLEKKNNRISKADEQKDYGSSVTEVTSPN